MAGFFIGSIVPVPARLAIEQRVAIVTGASRGIGRAISVELGARGAVVGLVGRDEQALKEVSTEVEARGARSTVFAADLANEEEAKLLAARIASSFGSLDVEYHPYTNLFPEYT